MRGDDRALPRPAVHLTGRGPRATDTFHLVLAVVAVVAGVAGLVDEWLHDWSGLATRLSLQLPAWLVWGGALVAGAVHLVRRGQRAPWYRVWSLVEVLEEHDRLTLFVGRLGPRHDGLVVRRGETVTLDAQQVRGATSAYRLTTPSGEMTFTADAFLGRLTREPLDEAARRAGVTVAVTGDAGRIRTGAPVT